MSEKIYEIVNDRIITLLEKGVVPWRKPWSSRRQSLAKNIVSGKAYQGINFMLTNGQAFASPLWGTYKQIESKGGQVKKGEKGTPIVFWKIMQYDDKEKEGKKKSVPLLKMSFVFNACQCDGIELEASAVELKDNKPIETCEGVIANFPMGFSEVRHVEHSAFYNPRLDYINMPKIETFTNAEHYYHVRFHESVHATGHASRLKREGVDAVAAFGDSVYSFEELVAELGASYLSAHCGISNVVVENSASYLAGWLKKFRSDKKFLFKASGHAQKAYQYLLNLPKEEDTED